MCIQIVNWRCQSAFIEERVGPGRRLALLGTIVPATDSSVACSSIRRGRARRSSGLGTTGRTTRGALSILASSRAAAAAASATAIGVTLTRWAPAARGLAAFATSGLAGSDDLLIELLVDLTLMCPRNIGLEVQFVVPVLLCRGR